MQDAGGGDNRRIALHLPQEAAQIYLGMPAPLAVAALRNLLDNALRHGGDTEVELEVQMADGQVGFMVRDHGRGLPKPICNT